MRLTKDGAEIHASPATGKSARGSALVDVCSQPCPSHRRLRFLHRGDSDVSSALHMGCDGAWNETGLALQRDSASDRRMGLSATSRSVSIQARVSIPDPRSRQHLRQGIECDQSELAATPAKLGQALQQRSPSYVAGSWSARSATSYIGTIAKRSEPSGCRRLSCHFARDSQRASPRIQPHGARRETAICLPADYLRTTGLLRALPEGQHREEAHPFAVPTGADDQRVDAEHGRELADKNSLSLRRRAPGSPRYLNLVRFRLK